MTKPYAENLGSMVVRVRNLIRGGTGDNDRILLSIHDAITHLQNTEHLWWMDVRGSMRLEDEVDQYPLSEMQITGAELRYVEDDLWVDIAGSEDNRHRVVRRSPSFLEDKREFQRYSNWPEYWAIEGDNMLIWPLPDSTHTLRFRAVARWPPPEIALDPTTSAVDDWDPDHTSPWFEHRKGFELTMYYSRVLLAGGELADDPEAMRAEKLFLQVVAGQRAATEELHLPHFSDPWPQLMY